MGLCERQQRVCGKLQRHGAARVPRSALPTGPELKRSNFWDARRHDLSAGETLALLCERKIARKDQRRIERALKLVLR
jgi:hypothetical protein